MSSINTSIMRCRAAIAAYAKANLCAGNTTQLNLLEAGVSSVDLCAAADKLGMVLGDTVAINAGASVNIDHRIMEMAGINFEHMNAATARQELFAMAEALKPVEQTLYSNAIVHALGDKLGYETRVEVGEQFTAIEAVQGHETMLVLVDGPDILTDQIGLSGSVCVEKQEALQQALADEGIEMEMHLKKHLDPQGGDHADVIKAAGRTHAGSLAKGIVEFVRANPCSNPMKGTTYTGKNHVAGKNLLTV